jgi:hypothetical protein
VGTDVSDEHAASIFRVDVSRVRMRSGYIGSWKEVTQIHQKERGDGGCIWANRNSEQELGKGRNWHNTRQSTELQEL